MRRYPLEPLLEQMREPSQDVARRRLQIGGRTFARYLSEGVSEATADRLASRVGFHASSVWPDWFDVQQKLVAYYGCVVCGRSAVEVERLPTVSTEDGVVVQAGAVVRCAEGHLTDLVVTALPHAPCGPEGPDFHSDSHGLGSSSPLGAGEKVAP